MIDLKKKLLKLYKNYTKIINVSYLKSRIFRLLLERKR
jgi:hypothetical protein